MLVTSYYFTVIRHSSIAYKLLLTTNAHNDLTQFNHLDTRQVQYSDPQCISKRTFELRYSSRHLEITTKMTPKNVT